MECRMQNSKSELRTTNYEPQTASIHTDALKRLRLIEEYSYLGAGFKIAERDMEIRGVGNILRKEQHGHIVNIGYELYAKFIENAIKELQGKEIEQVEPAIILNMNIMIPKKYITDDAKRLYYYRKFFRTGSLEEINQLAEECADIYGKLPVEMQNIVMLSKLKFFARKLGIYLIFQKGANVFCKYLQKKTDKVSSTINKLKIKNGRIKLIRRRDNNSFLLKLDKDRLFQDLFETFHNWCLEC